MTTKRPERILREYLAQLAERAGRGDAREESFYSAFEDLLRKCGAQLGRAIDVTVIPRKEQECLLDFQVWNGGRVAGYVEAKMPGTDLTDAAETGQLVRYRRTFPNLLLTDFREVRLFRNGELAARAAVSVGNWPELSVVLDRFFSFGGVTGPASAAWLATALAGRARVLSACVLDLLREERGRGEVSRIGGLLGAFREYLRAELDDQEFTDLYAQTIAYGLLAARLRGLDRFELRTVIENIPRGSGILRDVFEVLSLGELPATLRWIVEDLVDLLAAAPIQDVIRRDFDPARRKDVIQHFYETFLQAFDKGLRKKRGVYYTPQPVVSFMVRSVQALLRSRFGLADGLADPGVVLLDPAAGTLTFLTEAFRVALEAYAEAHGPGGRAALVRDHLLPHFQAFEVMMAPYAIGHWRARLFFEEQGIPLADGQRVRLYLTNALELEETRQTVFPFTAALARESLEAWRIKRTQTEAAVSVVIGNPPWSGHSANRSAPEIDARLRTSYYQVDGGPLGERNPKWLQDDYVKFLRFGQTRIEQSGAGILCFVTPHGYLDSPTFRGLRRSLLETFDEMYFLDLHGNKRKRERGRDSEPDDNVFDGVAQGVAVAILIKKPGLARRVFHAEVLGSRAGKERWLSRDVERDCWREARMTAPSYVIRGGGVRGGGEEYARGFPLPEIFPVRAVGVLTARDEVTIGFDQTDLEARIARLQEVLRRGDENPWRLDAARAERVRRALEDGAWRRQVREILYRPFDRRVILYLDALVDRPRREGMRPFLLPEQHNIGLVLPRQARGELAAFVTDRMIAHKAVSAYDINSVFPLRLAPEELFGGRPNLGEPFLAALGRAYGKVPSPEAVFHFVYAVLHSPGYRQDHEPFLREGFPRIPFPADAVLFAHLGTEGAELVDLHLLRPERSGEPGVRCTGDSRLALSRRPLWDKEKHRVLISGPDLCFEGVTPKVWAHRIGGYQVLRTWLTARAGRVLSLAEIEHFRRMTAALEGTLAVQLRIEEIWPEIRSGKKVEK